MVGKVDDALLKLPGGLRIKGFVVACSIVVAISIPVFYKSSGRQGHDYLSSDKPEAIHAGQEEMRRQYRQQRKLEQQEQNQNNQQK